MIFYLCLALLLCPRLLASQIVEQWTQLTGASPLFGGGGVCVAVDINDNVYVTGSASTTLDGQLNAGGNDLLLMKYDGFGAKLWTRLKGSSGTDVGYGG